MTDKTTQPRVLIFDTTLRDGEPYGVTRLNKKVARTAFALPA